MSQTAQTKQSITGEVVDTQTGEITTAHEIRALTSVEETTNTTPLDLPVEIFGAALERRKKNRVVLIDWIRSALTNGVDYGKIHKIGKSKCKLATQGRVNECDDPAHWSKPSLFKPGAEKICGMLGVTAHYPSLVEYERAVLDGKEIKTIVIRCELHNSACRVVADGVGARSVAQDYGNLNTSLKMAEKSAHIDATLRMAGLSEVFTQDLEDLAHQPTATPVVSKTQAKEVTKAETIGNREYEHIEAQINEIGLNLDRVTRWMVCKWEVQRFENLTMTQYQELMDRLPMFAKKTAEDLLKQAADLKESAQHAEGHAHYRDIGEAGRLEAEAKKMLAKVAVA